jgi:hypothetical protein
MPVTTANEMAIRGSIARLRAVYAWAPGKSQVFYEALCDLWPEDVEAGVTATLRDWRRGGCPVPGFVRERAIANRSGRQRPKAAPASGPVGWDDARTPLSEGDGGYLRDGDGRYVVLPRKPYPPLTTSGVPTYVPEDWE